MLGCLEFWGSWATLCCYAHLGRELAGLVWFGVGDLFIGAGLVWVCEFLAFKRKCAWVIGLVSGVGLGE